MSAPRPPAARPVLRPASQRIAAVAGVTFVLVALGLAVATAASPSRQASAYTRTWTARHQAAPNPVLQPGCGLDIGLLVDRSGSIANAGAEEQMRSAARTFIDAVAGTPSRLGVWSFGASSSPLPGDADHPAQLLTELGGAAAREGATSLKTTVSSVPYTGGATTNWDAGFRAVHAASASQGSAPDLLVVLTDGQPTVFGTATDPRDDRTEDADIDAGIAAANLVKAGGTRIFAVGIGADIDTAALSLISGGTPWNGSNLTSADYALTSFDELAATLHAAVSDLCGGSVTVQKVVRDGAGSELPEAGWRFDMDGPAHAVSETSGVTDDAGLVQFSIASVGTERVWIRERLQPGVDLVVEEIRCDNSSGDQPVLHVEDRGISFDLGPRDVVACTFPNLRIPEPTTTTTTPPATTTTPPTNEPPSTTTSSVSPTTTPTSTTASTSTTTSTSTSPATVLAKVQQPPGSLPRTGADPGRLVAAGLFLAAGGTLIVVGRPRSRLGG